MHRGSHEPWSEVPLHDATTDCRAAPSAAWFLEPMLPAEVMCRGDLDEQRRRLWQFCSAYGTHDLAAVVAWVPDRLSRLIDDMRQRATNGDPSFSRHVAAGHDERYAADIEHVVEHADFLAGAAPSRPTDVS